MERILRKKLLGGAFHDVSIIDSRRMAAIRGQGNKTTDSRFRAVLVRHGISGWKMHAKALPGCPDFFFPRQRVAVFLDGCFWHGCPKCGHVPAKNRPFWRAKIRRNKERDVQKARCLRRMGIRVVRIWEHDVTEHCLKHVLRLRECLEVRG